ncbi:MAG: RNase adapter RapZ [Candidatus Acidiferrales bacterium]|nr:RNase adapter RapZ [Acidobacteriota bacterium]
MPTQRSRSRRTSRPKRRRARQTAPLVIVTGLSGSGKGSVLKALEDLGYYCVDNLPIDLIPTFADLYLKTSGEVQRAALVVDIREGEALEKLPRVYENLRRTAPATLVFVEASDDALLRRFSETRRPHPLGVDLPLREGIRRERKLLKRIRARAEIVIDTTRFNPHELRRFVEERLVETDQNRALMISLVSFGYRYGVPPDADLVFDVRFLPNPNFVPAYKSLTGKDRRVARYVFAFPQAKEFMNRIVKLLLYLLPHYIREGKSYLTIGFGCTGGRHRSVAIAQAVREKLAGSKYEVKISHRDLGRGAWS